MAMKAKTEEKEIEKREEEKDTSTLHFDFQNQGVDEEALMEMTKAGVLYGHKKSRKNPRFNDYIFSVRNGIEVIDISKTVQAIEFVGQFLKKNVAEKKNILIIGTQPAAREAVEKLSHALGDCPYVVTKWIGGLITNFGVLSKRLAYYKKQKKGLAEGAFDKYTKRERLLMEREVQKMDTKFKGLEKFEVVPDVVFLIDSSPKNHQTALHEAHVKKLTVVGIIDNDDNPGDFNYFIPANDHARASIEWVVDRLIRNV